MEIARHVDLFRFVINDSYKSIFLSIKKDQIKKLYHIQFLGFGFNWFSNKINKRKEIWLFSIPYWIKKAGT